MRSKHLSKGEIVCIQNCSEKYIDMVNRMSYRMQDIEKKKKKPSHDFSVCSTGEKGLIQVVSQLPESYPGHSLLTEDEGVILGEDDCPCGRKGKYFEIKGRIKNAEIRGCSDTYERR